MVRDCPVVNDKRSRLQGKAFLCLCLLCLMFSLYRAILRNPSLILCDEVTSSVDAFAERDIVETLGNAMNDRTTITVAHRLSSIVHCDQILVLSKGRIVESGTHKELLDRNGLYRKMWDCQHNVGTFDSSSYSNGLVESDVV